MSEKKEIWGIDFWLIALDVSGGCVFCGPRCCYSFKVYLGGRGQWLWLLQALAVGIALPDTLLSGF